jgi:UDP-N-acetylmuramoyl-tripeptide--D-alanyl-D-alanine ligase
VKNLLYKLQLCGYEIKSFLTIARKKTTGAPVMTARAKRIYIMTVILCCFIIPLLFLPHTMAFAVLLLSPLEKNIKNKWLNKAKQKLNKFPNLIRIGITGSYGKTTCKNILYNMLSRQYKVLASRDSFNTPMGFAKTVNEDLTPDTEILIMEMGARHAGDIAEMCELVKPQHGIITGIGLQHVATFGSLANIRKTKQELFDYIGENGIKINGEDVLCNTHYETKLLGEHNQKNIAMCAEFAKSFGITEENINLAIAQLQSVPHRLQLITAKNGIRILDDSYNSNPVSAKYALDVLCGMAGKKVVQTAGFAEQGDNAYNANCEFGKQIAAVADAVIIIGELNKAAINGGLVSADYNKNEIHFAASREAAKSIYPQILNAGDILLIINDLPERY